MNQMLRVGAVIKPHGIRGEIKVWPTTDDPYRFDELSEIILVKGSSEKRIGISSVKHFKNIVILGLSGIDTVESAEALRGADLYVDREHAAPLSEGEYYIGDIIGMEVQDEEAQHLGTISDVIDTAANDVYVVKLAGRRDLLIPAIKQCIVNVDVENNLMTVRLLDGLMDL